MRRFFNIDRILIAVLGLSVAYLLGSQLLTQQQLTDAEGERSTAERRANVTAQNAEEVAQPVLELCSRGDATSHDLNRLGLCVQAEEITRVKGPQGPTGPAGDRGPRGYSGEDGDPGPQGITGAPGEMGPQGPSGDDGEDGRDGERGHQGEQGPTGETGPAGPPGEDGADGRTPSEMTCTPRKGASGEWDCEITDYEEGN